MNRKWLFRQALHRLWRCKTLLLAVVLLYGVIVLESMLLLPRSRVLTVLATYGTVPLIFGLMDMAGKALRAVVFHETSGYFF